MTSFRKPIARSRSMAGFTIVELIITVAVLAILIAIATPSFRELSLNNRTTSATNNLLADLALARNEAVKTARNAYVTNRGTWSDGWSVWVDADGDGTQGGEEPTLRQQDPVDADGVSAENSFELSAVSGATTGSTDIARVGFGSMGQVREPDDGARFAVCRPDGDRDKSSGVRIDLSGRAQSVKGLSSLNLSC